MGAGLAVRQLRSILCPSDASVSDGKGVYDGVLTRSSLGRDDHVLATEQKRKTENVGFRGGSLSTPTWWVN